MSIKLMSMVFETNLPTSEKFVLLAMTDYASETGESVYPSVATIVRKTSLSERTVHNCIKVLLDMGFLELVSEGGGRSNTNLYAINIGVLKGATVTKKGANDARKGATVTKKGAVVAPEPSLSVSNIPNNKPLSISANAETVYEPFNNQADLPQSFVDEYAPKKKGKDPRYNHVAYSMYYSITKRKPNQILIDDIIEIFGDSPDVEKARGCYRDWVAGGYHPQAANWIYWYRDGVPGYTKKSNEPAPFRPTTPDSDIYDAIIR